MIGRRGAKQELEHCLAALRDKARTAADRVEELRKLCDGAPLRDITEEWNAVLAARYARTRQHWHGPLRGAKWIDEKKCISLVVVDSYCGEPLRLDPQTWNGEPDYYDFRKVIAIPMDEYFRGRKLVHCVDQVHADGFGSLVARALNEILGLGNTPEVAKP